MPLLFNGYSCLIGIPWLPVYTLTGHNFNFGKTGYRGFDVSLSGAADSLEARTVEPLAGGGAPTPLQNLNLWADAVYLDVRYWLIVGRCV